MKKCLFTLFALLCTCTLYAQRGSVSATIVDGETGEAVVGAVVALSPTAKTDKVQHFTSGYQGSLVMQSVAYGEYKLVVSFLGYENYEQTFTLKQSKLNLGKLTLKSGVRIETVVKEAKAIRASQKGDTISYNAGAFKVANDADVA